jgi:hypothetical protein
MSRDEAWPWSVLGLDRMPPSTGDIRRAYARALKAIDQAKDIEGFAALRGAYERGLEIRENRIRRGERRKQRRAEATAKTKADPADADLLPHHQPLPIADPRPGMVQAMLLELHQENLMIPTSLRILHLLKRPEAGEPEFERQIRAAIARLIRHKFQIGFLDADITDEVLLALDARYGWLSDYAAYRRDFHSNPALQHAMNMRAFGQIAQPVTPIPLMPSRRGRVWNWINSNIRWLWPAYFFVLLAAGRSIDLASFGTWTTVLLMLVLLLPILVGFVLAFSSMWQELLPLLARLQGWLGRQFTRTPKP